MQQTVIDNRYTLVELLGSGGMAEVYLAHDEVLDREVALKVLRELYADDEQFVERFRREARSAAGLSHPNIVSVYDQGRSEDGAYYMAMEYVPRGTLKDRILQDGALAPDAATGVALQIAGALSAAHERGVIHRDIKPQNILVAHTGDVKVADFGIARAASSTATATGAVLGTAGYMSPEQAKGEPVGPRSDLYSLGVVLFEMLTGNLPYEADSALAQAVKHVNEPPPSPRESNFEVSEELDSLTIKLLAKNPEDRYPSAAALASDLQRTRSGLLPVIAEPEKKTEAITAPLPPSPDGRTKETAVRPRAAAPVRAPGRGGRRRGRLLSALVALLFVVALLGSLVWTLTHSGPPERDGSGGGAQEETNNVQTPVQDPSAPGKVAGDASGGDTPNGNLSDNGASGGVVQPSPQGAPATVQPQEAPGVQPQEAPATAQPREAPATVQPQESTAPGPPAPQVAPAQPSQSLAKGGGEETKKKDKKDKGNKKGKGGN